MATRDVTGFVYHTTGVPWESARVIFHRRPLSQSTTTIYPADTVRGTTDATGAIGVEDDSTDPATFTANLTLWATDSTGATDSYYTAIFPGGDVFHFLLPEEAGTPLDINTLRTSYAYTPA